MLSRLSRHPRLLPARHRLVDRGHQRVRRARRRASSPGQCLHARVGWQEERAVGALLVVAVPGANAVPAAWRAGTAPRSPAAPAVLFAALAAVLALAAAGFVVALVVLLRRPRRKDEEPAVVPPPADHGPLARLVAVAVAVLALAAPFVALVIVRHFPAHPAAPVAVPSAEVSPGPQPGPAPAPYVSGLVAVAEFGVAAVLLLALAAWSVRRRARRPARSAATALAEAAEAGTAALSGDDPRTGVLRCYAAMARALRHGGVAGRASDVPGELLARAAASGAIPAQPARELTDLFGVARYSSRPVTEAQRQAATAALARIRNTMRGAP